ncbi:MAG: hypothetical protein WAV00_21130 [Nocardioides sp.]
MARRLTDVNSILAALVALPLLVACSSDPTPHATPQDGGTTLSQDQIAKAEAVARQAIKDQGASVSNATVIARPGKVKDSNTGHPCSSGHELQIKLIGKFPHTVTTGHPVPPGSPAPDFTVRAMIITADAESGLACLIGVQTGENGWPKPLAGGTRLSLS